ncbi:MAG TPA: hypothetical protein VF092_08400 [Longimicrobium sp.]
MKPSRIDVSIDSLVLDGFPAGQQRRIGAAFRAELRRLIAAGDVSAPAGPSAVPRVDAPRVSVAADAPPRTVGREVARAVYRGVWG